MTTAVLVVIHNNSKHGAAPQKRGEKNPTSQQEL